MESSENNNFTELNLVHSKLLLSCLKAKNFQKTKKKQNLIHKTAITTTSMLGILPSHLKETKFHIINIYMGKM